MAYTWSLVTHGFTVDGASPAWLGDRFIVLGYDSNACIVSPTGAAGTWTLSTLPDTGNWGPFPAVYSGNLCIPAAASIKVLYGNDVDGWALGTLPEATHWLSCAVDPSTGTFVAVSNTSTTYARTTTPTGTWDAVTGPAEASCIRFGGAGAGYFLTVFNDTWCKSADGSDGSWSTGSLPLTDAWSLVWNGSVWIALGAAGGVATSPDGETWTDRGTVGSGANWYNLVARDTEVLAFLDNTSTLSLNADDGVTWAERSDGAGTAYIWNGTAYDGDATVLVATTDAVLLGTFAPSIQGDAADTVVGATSLNGQVRPMLADALTAAGTFTPDVLANLIDRLVAGGSTSSLATLQGTATTSANFTDAVQSAWQLLVAESIEATGDAVGTVHKLVAVLDALVATGQANGKMTALAACAAAMTMEGLIRQGFQPDVVDQALLTESVASVARILGPLVDSATAADTALPMLRVSLIAGDSLAVASDLGAILSANADLADGVLVFAALRIGDAEFSGWALNTDALAASEHRNVAFDSFASYRGQHYAAGPNGIVRFGGDTDDGAKIDAWLKTALLDFGTGKKKRTPDAYVAVNKAGDLVLKVISRDPVTGVRVEDWYLATRRQADGPGMGRVEIGRGIVSTWMQYELHNVDGGALEIDSLALRPLILDRRV